ncbi:C40 family peptidase [Lachnospiraceae bacterium JLR.KK008]
MKHNNMKFAAYALVGVIAVGSISVSVDATGVSSLLPAAGLTLTMEEGSAQEEVRASTKSKTDNKEREKEKENKEKKEEKEENSTKSLKRDIGVKDSDEEIKPVETAAVSVDKQQNKEEQEDDQEHDREEEKAEEEKEFSKLVIAKVNDYVNVRSVPSEDGEIVGKLYDKSVGNFIFENNGWYKITSGNVTGYVKAEYCVTGEEAVALAKEVGTRVATVTTTTLKVRESEGMDAPVLGLVPIDEELSVIEELDGWVKVDIEEGYGFVSSEYVSLRTDFVKAESKEEEEARLRKEEEAKQAAKEAARKAEEKVAKDRAAKEAAAAQKNNNGGSQEQQAAKPAPAPASGGSGLGNAVVDYAMQFVGNPYVYGGTSLTNGADCSGFVMSVYKNFGVSLPHSSSADRSQGYDVGGLENAQPGDLVCYSGHVGIYAGNGQIVHASTSKTGIIVSNANYRNVLAVRRIF